MPVARIALLSALSLLAGALLTGCGGDGSAGQQAAGDPVSAVSASLRDQVATARKVDVSAFPKPHAGQTLEAFAGRFDTDGPVAVAASSVLRPPTNRLAFGLLDADQRFVYGKTVVYVQRRGTNGPIEGPIAAPGDVLVTAPRYRSEQAAAEKDPFSAIYHAEIPTPRPGVLDVLVVTDAGGRRLAAPMAVQVKSRAQDTVPDVGERAPKVQTDTLGSVKGNVDLLTTRLPATSELGRTSFADVVGHKPIALLFATPQLC